MLHRLNRFDRYLREIHDYLLEMGRFCDKQLNYLISVVVDNDEISRKKIQSIEAKVDILEDEVCQKIITSIARLQPVASDLKLLLSSQLIARNFERMSDYGRNIANIASYLHKDFDGKVPSSFLELMIKSLHSELLILLDTLDREDVGGLYEIAIKEQEINDIFSLAFKEYLTYMIDDPSKITLYTRLLFTAKSLERIGDLIKSAAVNAYYAFTGERIEIIEEIENISPNFVDEQEASEKKDK